MLAAMRLAGEAPADVLGAVVNGDALTLPFADGAFDRVIASEVLEHVPADAAAMAELARVLRPGGTLALTVPRWWPEKVCWALAEEYHAPQVPDGHVRIYTRSRLAWLVVEAGLRPTRSHHAHALHSPYWWLKCALGLDRPDRWPVRIYHRFLVWDIMRRPLLTRALDRALNPFLGKSLVLYAEKP
jgi:SAM-dependent methyltransferase